MEDEDGDKEDEDDEKEKRLGLTDTEDWECIMKHQVNYFPIPVSPAAEWQVENVWLDIIKEVDKRRNGLVEGGELEDVGAGDVTSAFRW